MIIITVRPITILNSYSFDINISFIKVINNYKNYNYLHKDLKGLVLYKSNSITFSSFFKINIVIFNLDILLEDYTMNRAKDSNQNNKEEPNI
ncbi:hypothetical protein C8035_v004833 [Colletotrichum spinosum]|uniref:Uncharacterized protein n=1 Tax=Colletotrichum spinosum TaxID=1347390 RepID=A0A4V3HQZ2_9PEZI|nr:hypothetical protein C8035_v004833 [Colletotrichum spinosum]